MSQEGSYISISRSLGGFLEAGIDARGREAPIEPEGWASSMLTFVSMITLDSRMSKFWTTRRRKQPTDFFGDA
jgi:hypothetical protein